MQGLQREGELQNVKTFHHRENTDIGFYNFRKHFYADKDIHFGPIVYTDLQHFSNSGINLRLKCRGCTEHPTTGTQSSSCECEEGRTQWCIEITLTKSVKISFQNLRNTDWWNQRDKIKEILLIDFEKCKCSHCIEILKEAMMLKSSLAIHWTWGIKNVIEIDFQIIFCMILAKYFQPYYYNPMM